MPHYAHSLREFSIFTTHLAQNTNDIWQQTNGSNTQIAGILQLQKELRVFEKFICDVQNVYHRPKHMHSDDITKVFGFKLSKHPAY